MRNRAVFRLIFFFQAEDGIRDKLVTGVQTCALPISPDRTTTHRYPPNPGPCATPLPPGCCSVRRRAARQCLPPQRASGSPPGQRSAAVRGGAGAPGSRWTIGLPAALSLGRSKWQSATRQSPHAPTGKTNPPAAGGPALPAPGPRIGERSNWLREWFPLGPAPKSIRCWFRAPHDKSLPPLKAAFPDLPPKALLSPAWRKIPPAQVPQRAGSKDLPPPATPRAAARAPRAEPQPPVSRVPTQTNRSPAG